VEQEDNEETWNNLDPRGKVPRIIPARSSILARNRENDESTVIQHVRAFPLNTYGNWVAFQKSTESCGNVSFMGIGWQFLLCTQNWERLEVKKMKKTRVQRETTRINDFQWGRKEERLQLSTIWKCLECNMPTLRRRFKCNTQETFTGRKSAPVNLSDRCRNRNRPEIIEARQDGGF
jgi:hypothetical protein